MEQLLTDQIPFRKGVCKQWNGLLEWWNTGMVEWKFLKVYYEFLHLNIP